MAVSIYPNRIPRFSNWIYLKDAMRLQLFAFSGLLSFGFIALSQPGLGQPQPAVQSKPSVLNQSSSSRAALEKQTFDRRVVEIINQPDIPVGLGQTQLRNALNFYQAQQDQDGQSWVYLAQAHLAYRDGDYVTARRLLLSVPQSFQKPFYGRRQLLDGMLLIEAGEARSGINQLNLVQGFVAQDWSAQHDLRIATAEAFRYIGRYRDALQQISLSRRSNVVEQAQTASILADIYLDLGQYDKARDKYQEAIRMREGIPSFWGQRNLSKIVQNRTNLGRTYRFLGQPAEAQKQFAAAQTMVSNLNDSTSGVLLLTQIGLTYLENGQAQQAEQTLLDAVEKSRNYGQESAQVSALSGLGRYYQVQKKWDLAIQTYSKASEMARIKQESLGQAKALTGLGELYVQTQRWDEAIEALTKTVELYEAMRPGLNDQDKVAIADSQAYAYQLLQRAQVAKGQPHVALVTSERGRARAFVEQLATRLSNEPIPSIPAPDLRAIQTTAKQQQATLVSYSVLRDPLTRSETELYIWVISPQGEITFRRIDLQQNQGLSIDKIARDARSTTITGFNPSNTPAITNLIVALRSSTQNSNRSRDRTQTIDKVEAATITNAARNAYALLIDPIADLLPKNPNDRVVFIPQGSLFVVPFQALQDKQGKYLIEKHTIQIAPSIQALQLVQKERRNTGQPLIVGNPAPMPEDLAPLPGAEAEAKAISQLLKSTAILGSAATETSIEEKIDKASILHFATHGLVDDERGLGSAIALVKDNKTDGLLTADEIFSLKLNANLAVLSACDTGRGKITGDGVIGLSRSLMSAGVPSVVVSLWAVPDVATQSLMTDFYRNLQQQPDKAKALRKAMLSTMKQYPNPADWGGFVLVGSAD